MSTALLRLAPAVLLAIAACHIMAATSTPVPVEVPSEFHVVKRSALISGIHTKRITEMDSPFPDKETIEAVCGMLRSTGGTHAHPRFDAEYGKPIRATVETFTVGRDTAKFSKSRTYVCDASDKADSCSCFWRPQPVNTVWIRKNIDGGSQVITVEFPAGTGTQVVGGKLPPFNLEQARRSVTTLMPTVLGKGDVLGIPCVWRRQNITELQTVDACVIEERPAGFPEILLYTGWSEKWTDRDGHLFTFDTVLELDVDAQFDAGVFDVPEGAKLKLVADHRTPLGGKPK